MSDHREFIWRRGYAAARANECDKVRAAAKKAYDDAHHAYLLAQSAYSLECAKLDQASRDAANQAEAEGGYDSSARYQQAYRRIMGMGHYAKPLPVSPNLRRWTTAEWDALVLARAMGCYADKYPLFFTPDLVLEFPNEYHANTVVAIDTDTGRVMEFGLYDIHAFSSEGHLLPNGDVMLFRGMSADLADIDYGTAGTRSCNIFTGVEYEPTFVPADEKAEAFALAFIDALGA